MLISIEWFRLFFIQMKYHYYIKLIVFTLFFIACSDSNEGTSNVPQINPKKCIDIKPLNDHWYLIINDFNANSQTQKFQVKIKI